MRGRRQIERAVEALRSVDRRGVCPACRRSISPYQKTAVVAGKLHHERCAKYVRTVE